MAEAHEVALRVFNSKQKTVTFVLEPWGETYAFAPGDEFIVLIQGPMGGRSEIDFGDDAVAVYGWPGSTAKLFKNEEELGVAKSKRTPVPGMP